MAYPCKKREQVGDTLRLFADDVSIPDRLRKDLAPEIPGNRAEFQD